MDILTIFGLILALFAIIFGQFLEGGHLAALLNLPALVIVLGGSIGAVMVETPWKTFMQAIKISPWILFPPDSDFEGLITKIAAWGTIARRNGVLSLQSVLDTETDPFVIKSLSMLVDGGDPKSIRQILQIEVDSRENNFIEATRVFESMGGYSPTIGIIGAVVGLIHVMNNLSDPKLLGTGIAVAFVATIYGVGLANILWIPMANKLQKIVILDNKRNRALIEGIVSISTGENPRITKFKLRGYQ